MKPNLGLSDLAASQQSLLRNANVKTALFLTGQKLATNEKTVSEIASEGNVGRVFAMDHSLEMVDRYTQTINAGRVRLDTLQTVLGNVRDIAATVNLGVLSTVNSGDMNASMIEARGAIPALEAVVSMLNTNVAGQSLFSGAATDRAALVDASQIQNDIDTIVAAAPDATTALANIDFYFFNAAGGFPTTAYVGSTSSASDIRVGENETIAQNIKADDNALRETIRNLTVISAVANGAFPLSVIDQKALLLDASQKNLSTSDAVIKLREGTGYDQERLEAASVRNQSERSRLLIARVDIANVDPYETASMFQDLQAQVEKMYTVTARLAQLSLTNFLR